MWGVQNTRGNIPVFHQTVGKEPYNHPEFQLRLCQAKGVGILNFQYISEDNYAMRDIGTTPLTKKLMHLNKSSMLKKGLRTNLDVALSAVQLKKHKTKAAEAMTVKNAKCSQLFALLAEKNIIT